MSIQKQGDGQQRDPAAQAVKGNSGAALGSKTLPRVFDPDERPAPLLVALAFLHSFDLAQGEALFYLPPGVGDADLAAVDVVILRGPPCKQGGRSL